MVSIFDFTKRVNERKVHIASISYAAAAKPNKHKSSLAEAVFLISDHHKS